MSTAEGRVVKNGSTWDYEYFHKDHLGNTRVVYGYQKQVDEYKATMETALATKEESEFRNVWQTRKVSPYNHTASSYHTLAPDKVCELNGALTIEGSSTPKSIGLAKVLQVSAGDRVELEVFARYSSGVGSNNTLIPSIVSVVTGAFGLGSGEAPYTTFSNNLGGIAGGISRNGSASKAYLFYILLDASYNYYGQFGYASITTAASIDFERLYLDVTVPQGGFLYTYVVNESAAFTSASVYFDDFSVVHIRSTNALQVVQVEDYYPFGLAFNSYSRENSTAQDFKYNGKEEQNELSLGWLDYGWRIYDPTVARWNRVDGLAEKYLSSSPYHYAANNPILNYDIDGNQFTPAAKKWADNLRKNIETRMNKNVQKILDKSNRLNTGVDKKGNQLSERKANRLVQQINRMENENAGLKQTRSEINTLEQSDQVYNVVTSDKFSDSNFSKAATAYNASTGEVDIILPSKAGLNLFAHEAYHAYSFKIGRMSISAHDGNLNMLPIRNWLAYDQQDENEAYFRQGLFGSTQHNLPHEYRNRPPNSTWIIDIPTIRNLIQMPPNVKHNALQRIATQNGMAFRIGGVTYGLR